MAFHEKWNMVLRQNIAEAKAVQSTGGLLVEVRNNAEHLNVLTKLDKYVTEFASTKMTSYFQLYHFVLQKILREDNDLPLGDLPKKLKRYHCRKPDGGRKKNIHRDETLLSDLQSLVESPRWTI